MSRFGPDPQAFFDAVYQQTPPWDIGGPQPALEALLDEFPPSGPVLDVGCGSGDHAIAIARRGVEVLGVDIVEAAIAQANAKAAALPPELAERLQFQVADALRPAQLGRQFGAVVDSGFLHLFEQQAADRFVEELAASLRLGGRYYLPAFAVQLDIPNVPRAVTVEELQARFTPERGWHILALAVDDVAEPPGERGDWRGVQLSPLVVEHPLARADRVSGHRLAAPAHAPAARVLNILELLKAHPQGLAERPRRRPLRAGVPLGLLVNRAQHDPYLPGELGEGCSRSRLMRPPSGTAKPRNRGIPRR